MLHPLRDGDVRQDYEKAENQHGNRQQQAERNQCIAQLGSPCSLPQGDREAALRTGGVGRLYGFKPKYCRRASMFLRISTRTCLRPSSVAPKRKTRISFHSASVRGPHANPAFSAPRLRGDGAKEDRDCLGA